MSSPTTLEPLTVHTPYISCTHEPLSVHTPFISYTHEPLSVHTPFISYAHEPLSIHTPFTSYHIVKTPGVLLLGHFYSLLQTHHGEKPPMLTR